MCVDFDDTVAVPGSHTATVTVYLQTQKTPPTSVCSGVTSVFRQLFRIEDLSTLFKICVPASRGFVRNHKNMLKMFSFLCVLKIELAILMTPERPQRGQGNVNTKKACSCHNFQTR